MQQMQRPHLVCRALESYMSDKLRAAESTFKELQLRMADPDVASDASEFQKVGASSSMCNLYGLLMCTCGSSSWPVSAAPVSMPEAQQQQ